MESASAVFQAEHLRDSARERSLQNLVPIKPGQVLNPKGGGAAGHALAAYIREKTLNGITLADFLFSVVNGKDSIFLGMKDRLKAVELLLNRGWGQAPQSITIGNDPQGKPLLDLTKLTAAEFEQFKALAVKIAPVGEQTQETASQEPRTDTISPKDVPKVQP